jgi:hypothetical protein
MIRSLQIEGLNRSSSMLRNNIAYQSAPAQWGGNDNYLMTSSRMRLPLRAAALFSWICILAVAWLNIFNPNSWALGLSCPFHSITGLHCPGCGATRALLELMRGHWAAALHLNPLVVCTVPPAACLLLWCRRPRIPSGLWWTMLVSAVAFGIMRNIPAYPFTLLSPG